MRSLSFIFVLMPLWVGGCARGVSDRSWPEPGPLGEGITAYRPSGSPKEKAAASEGVREDAAGLTLARTLSLTLLHDPGLQAFAWDVRSAEAKTIQAGLLPNPEVRIDAEDLLGSKDYRWARQMQLTVQLGQVVELGGKRAARLRSARKAALVSGFRYELKRIEVLTTATKRFIDVLCAQECIRHAEVMVKNSQQVYSAFLAKVEAGDVSRLLLTRASVAAALSRIELGKAKRKLEAARRILVTHWSKKAPRFTRALGQLALPHVPRSFSSLSTHIDRSAELRLWTAEVARASEEVSAQRSQSFPDITFSAGVRYLQDPRDVAFVFGISVPLPFFSRNQGEVLSARFAEVKARRALESSRRAVLARLARAHGALVAAADEARALKESVLPAAESVFQKTREGYSLGKFGYLDLLDAQRTLFGARRRYLVALADALKAGADVEGLLGVSLSVIRKAEKKGEEKAGAKGEMKS